MHVRHDWHSIPPCALALVVVAGACVAEPVPGNENDGSTETGSTSLDTGTSNPSLGSSDEGELSTGAVGETTAAIDDTGADTEDTGGFIPEMDLGDVPAGFCFGISDVGHLSTVYASAELTMPACNPEPAPCGGDVVGTWTIDSHCGFESLSNFFAGDCPSSTMSYVASELTGTQVLGDDGSFSLEGELSIDLDLQIDTDTCFGVGCGQFGDLLTMQDNNLEVACVEAEGSEGCDCAMTITNTLEREGTYAVEGDMITLTTDVGTADPAPFCVAGDHLTIWEVLNETQAYPKVTCDVPEDCERALGDEHDEWLCI